MLSTEKERQKERKKGRKKDIESFVLAVESDAYIYILDTYRRNHNRRKNKGCRKEDTRRLL